MDQPSTSTGCFSGLKRVFASPSKTTRKTIPARSTEEQSHSGQSNIPCLHDPRLKGPLWTHVKTVKTTSGECIEPPPYSAIAESDEHGSRSDILNTIVASVELYSADLCALSLKIHDHPEIGFKEFYAHDTLTAFMKTHDFKVTPHFLGVETAWRAEWSQGRGGRTLGINSEMDALPGIGHACGHNLIAMAGVGVALAVKDAMQKHNISGKVVLLGTPAEEGGGGKVMLLERGAYKDMDICIMTHPSPGPQHTFWTGSSTATQPFVVEYFGHTAHAAVAPWEGQNALDAAVIAYNSVAVLRQQIKPDCRVHGIIEGRNWSANIIPDYAKMSWIVRGPSRDEKQALFERVKACIEAAAHATACEIKISVGVAYDDMRQNPVLENECLRIASRELGIDAQSDVVTFASTDFGNVSYALPALHPNFTIPTVPGGGNHTPEFTKAARTTEAHEAALSMVKALAMLGVRTLGDKVFYRQVKDSYEEMLKKVDI